MIVQPPEAPRIEQSLNTKSDADRDLDELHQDPVFQRRFWVVERIAWVGFILLLATAITGLTGGGGPLAQAIVETAAGSIEYPRVSRWQAADSMIVRFAPGAADGALEFEPVFIETFEVTSIQPEPRSATTTPNGVRYEFDVERGGEIVLRLRARRPAFPFESSVRVGEFHAPIRALILP